MIAQLTDLLFRFRWLLLLLSLVLTGAATQGFKHFEFDASPRSFFSEEYPHYQRFLQMEETYGKDFRLFFMVSCDCTCWSK